MAIVQHTLGLYKRCSLCKIEKPNTEYHPRQSQCKVCANKTSKASYARHREARIHYQTEYNAKPENKARKRQQREETNYNQRYRTNRQAWSTVRRARKRSGGKFSVTEWRALKLQYGYRCLRCDAQEPDIQLQPDHVLPLSQGGTNTINNIQPLCGACNLWKASKHIDFRKQ